MFWLEISSKRHWSFIILFFVLTTYHGIARGVDTGLQQKTNNMFKKYVVPIFNKIDMSDSNDLYFAQPDLMLVVENYINENKQNQEFLIEAFQNIIVNLPYLDNLRKNEIALSDYLADERKSGKGSRRVFPTLNRGGEIYDARLAILQFSYLISRLTTKIVDKSLKEELTEKENQFLKLASNFLYDDVVISYYKNEAWWYRTTYPSMKARIEARLSPPYSKVLAEHSYSTAFVDEDFFLMAIASDLKYISLKYKKLLKTDDLVLDEILKNTYLMMEGHLDWNNEGFVFDKGKWRDHPEYRHSGYEGLKFPKREYLKRDAVIDTSHAYRWPLWLDSFKKAYSKNSSKYLYYDNLISKLTNQFEKVIVITELGPKLKNMFDGSNGWYNVKKDWGYGPFTLSTMARHGSWYLLGNRSPKANEFLVSMEEMITSKDEKVINFRTKFYGEYDYQNIESRNERGLRAIDLMGGGSFPHYKLILGRRILRK